MVFFVGRCSRNRFYWTCINPGLHKDISLKLVLQTKSMSTNQNYDIITNLSCLNNEMQILFTLPFLVCGNLHGK